MVKQQAQRSGAIRISSFSTAPVSLAIGRRAMVRAGFVDETGQGVADLEATLFADKGLLSTSGEEWARSIGLKTNRDGWVEAIFLADEANTTPGLVNLIILAGQSTQPHDVESTVLTVIGPPASITLTAAPNRLAPGEIVTVTATIKDAIGQNVADGTTVRFSTTPEGKLTQEMEKTRGGSCTTFLLTSNSTPGIYTIVGQVEGISAVVSIETRPPYP